MKKPLIGIVMPILARNHIRSIVRGAIAQIREAGCDCILLSPLCHFTQCPPEHAETERRIYRFIQSDQFDGFLYVKDDTTMGNDATAEVESMLMLSNKYVMTVDEREHPVFDSTQYDDYDDFSKVVRHLIEVHGYKRIYCLTGPDFLFQAQTRLKAYQDQMTEHGLYFDESYYFYGTFWVDCAKVYAEKIISGLIPKPEAVVCGNDIMAVALISELTRAGFSVPKDIAVTGYDGVILGDDSDVTLTTYSRNHFQLGADAVRRLYRNMTGKLCNKVHQKECGFINGNSCGCSSIPARQMLTAKSETVPAMWREEMFCDDIPFSLAQAESVTELLQRAMVHAKKLYHISSLRLFLLEDENLLRCKASLAYDTPYDKEVYPADDVAHYLENSTEPETVFLSVLHFNKHIFGTAALSFQEHERLYDEYYLRLITHTELALHRWKMCEKHLPDNAAQSLRQKEIRRKMNDLRNQLMNEPGLPWTVDKMSRITGMGRSTIQKQYRACFGKSIFEELILFRVGLAGKLLKQTDLSLPEIAEKCGYSTESYFMKQFKSVTGTTPTEFRKQQEDKF